MRIPNLIISRSRSFASLLVASTVLKPWACARRAAAIPRQTGEPSRSRFEKHSRRHRLNRSPRQFTITRTPPEEASPSWIVSRLGLCATRPQEPSRASAALGLSGSEQSIPWWKVQRALVRTTTERGASSSCTVHPRGGRGRTPASKGSVCTESRLTCRSNDVGTEPNFCPRQN